MRVFSALNSCSKGTGFVFTAAKQATLNKVGSFAMSCFRSQPRSLMKPKNSSTFSSDISSQWFENGKMRRSISSLSKIEPSDLYGTAERSHVHVEDVWREVRTLERHRSTSSRYREIGRTMEPVIDFFTRYSPVLDATVQSGSSISGLVWGSLKAVLMV